MILLMALITIFFALLSPYLVGANTPGWKENLCKKWYIHHYTYMWIDYAPEEKDKDDFMLFNEDMTYVSVDEGNQSTGQWSYDVKEKSIKMFNAKGESIKLLIKEWETDKLVFKIEDKELKSAVFHYSTSKRKQK